MPPLTIGQTSPCKAPMLIRSVADMCLAHRPLLDHWSDQPLKKVPTARANQHSSNEHVRRACAAAVDHWSNTPLCSTILNPYTTEGGIALYIPDDQEISRGPRDVLRAKPEGHLESLGKSLRLRDVQPNASRLEAVCSHSLIIIRRFPSPIQSNPLIAYAATAVSDGVVFFNYGTQLKVFWGLV